MSGTPLNHFQPPFIPPEPHAWFTNPTAVVEGYKKGKRQPGELKLPLGSGTYMLMLTISIVILVIWRRSLEKSLVLISGNSPLSRYGLRSGSSGNQPGTSNSAGFMNSN
jgi:hypothetical protein